MEQLSLDYMGAMLKKERIAANFTQEELAENVGVTARYIMSIENEGKCPSLDVWFRLIRALHASADAIVYPEEKHPDDDRLLRMINMLSDRDRKIVQTVVQAMLTDCAKSSETHTESESKILP